MPAKKIIEVWVCEACGAKHWPQVVAGRGQCPSCGNPTGVVQKVEADE